MLIKATELKPGDLILVRGGYATVDRLTPKRAYLEDINANYYGVTLPGALAICGSDTAWVAIAGRWRSNIMARTVPDLATFKRALTAYQGFDEAIMEAEQKVRDLRKRQREEASFILDGA